MEVSSSSEVLPEVTMEKEEEEEVSSGTSNSKQDPVPAVSPTLIGNATELVTTGESSESTTTEGQSKSSQVASGTVAGKDEQSGTVLSLIDSMDYDLPDLADRVKIAAMSRRRKNVQLFVFNVPEEKPPTVVGKGAGCKLEEIPSIATQINKRLYFDLIRLHRFLFVKGGTTEEIKTRLKLFSGFTFASDSDEYKKKRLNLRRLDEMTRDVLCDCLALDKSGDEEKVMENLLNFAMKPESTGVVCNNSPQPHADEKALRTHEQVEAKASTNLEQDDAQAATSRQASEAPAVIPEQDESVDSQKTEISQDTRDQAAETKVKKPNKRKPKKGKENIPVEDQDQPNPPKRKKTTFKAPIRDKSKQPKQKPTTSKPKAIDESASVTCVSSAECV